MTRVSNQSARPQSVSVVNINSLRTVVITGGAGFIGSQLCDRHIERGDKVLCLDDLSTGRMENITHLIDHPKFAFRKHDVIEPYSVQGPVDLIYNMACPASPPKYQADPIKTLKVSIFGAENALKLALEKNAVVLQASTSEVYGDPEVSPQSEDYWGNTNSFGPRSCYDEGKRAAETLFHDYHERYGVRIRIARIFNTYGPRMDPEDGRVVSNFICQSLKGTDITVYGDGSQTRSFCYVDDLLDGLMALVQAPDDVFYPVNVGNPGEFTINELAHILQDLVPSNSKLVHEPLPVDDPKQRCPDIRLAERVLGWKPKVSLSEGLQKTIPYFAAELRANRVLSSRAQ
ncbi:UDP-glucuronic acid decarboxylase family protein [Aestuariivita boseongensis]|uniref:UDP-glucuronic acid decarboxylase family protein n=1 Tax=Aestuariivita boseongensis TaxID=1470562 RepID=UPI0006800655|nr:UDP-glucuronic acid decarboxylase family protein [Aestuariivita boseongensis]